MGGTKLVGNVGVILAFLIGVLDYDTDWGACSFPLKHPRKNLDFVFFFSLGGDFGLTGLPALHFQADLFFVQLQPSWAAFHDCSQGFAV
jgi:hypothetical protein